MRKLLQYLEDFLSLFYPELCLACAKNLPPGNEAVCIQCQYYLPKTNFHKDAENAFAQRFWGRVNIQGGTALYHFVKSGRTQKLIHNLKYKSRTQIGINLGRLYGKTLRVAPVFKEADLILPVPLHPRKEKKRGYNQCDLFAKGLSESMEIPWKKGLLVKTEDTATQTKKTRAERFENVATAFKIAAPEKLRGKHILIVDDVITTGATLEACAQKVLEIPGVKVSLATIAIARQ